MKHILIASAIFAADFAFAGKIIEAPPELRSALANITDGKIVKVEEETKGKVETYEVTVESTNQHVKEVEVTRNKFELLQAEGDSLSPANFKPGYGLSPLGALTETLKKYPGFAANKWALDKDADGQWIYEVSGTENGVKKEYHFHATTLALMKVEND